MKTILSHFYNEEYLLPFWLNHHKKFFDHGIMINYQSTDKSVEIIKTICPTWEIHDSRNNCFDAIKVDREIIVYERSIQGWRICLNTTEFLVGDYTTLDNLLDMQQQLIVPVYTMVDKKELTNEEVVINDLIREKTFGLPNPEDWGRSLHNFVIGGYSPGRHWLWGFEGCRRTDNFVILRYTYSPWNKSFISRKLQIGNKIPESDKKARFGVQHFYSEEKHAEILANFQKRCVDLSILPILNNKQIRDFF